MPSRLDGKQVVVVGGTSGIGRAIAEAVSGLGGRVAVVGRNVDRVAALREAHPDWQIAIADITDSTAIGSAFERFGRCDHVVVSAGSIIPEPVNGDIERLRAPFEERVFGLLNVVRAALPLMATDGSVICVTGDLVSRPVAGLAAVAAAAAAVETLAMAMVLELAPLRFNVISPGAVDTPLMTPLMGEEGRLAMLDELAQKGPTGRIGAPAEIADLAISVLTNRYINGSVLTIDGGMRLT